MFVFRDKKLPLNREIRCTFRCIKGVGNWKSVFIACKAGLAFPFFTVNVNFYNSSLCFFLLKNLVISEVRIMRFMSMNIKNLIAMRSFKGFRHQMFLPVRGQRTRTNAGTARFLRNNRDRVLWK